MTKPNCSKCGELKHGWYVNESWCSKCVNARKAELRSEKRAAKDLPPIGSGRDPKCKDCRELKEESYKNGNYCGKCKCAREKIRYQNKKDALGILTKRCKKGRNPICNCGTKKEHPNEAFCNSCTAQKKRELRLKKRNRHEWKKNQIAKANKKMTAIMRIECRKETRKLIFKGVLKYAPCEICSTTDDIQAHHDDYLKPLNVRWLCRKHHVEYHSNENK